MSVAGGTTSGDDRRTQAVTPRGFRDVMPQEAGEREVVGGRVALALDAWGYRPIETPVAELARVLEEAAGSLDGVALRLIDVDGAVLALRPDMTLPIARLVATRMDGWDGPLRLRYNAPVFRERESLRGEAREFTQIGVELIGLAGAAADAEVVALAVDALEAAGLTDYSVVLGTVAVLEALLERSGSTIPWRSAMRSAVHDRDLVRVRELASEPEGSAVGRAIEAVLRTRGGRQAIAKCRAILDPFGAGEALDDFEATWDLLDSAGYAERVRVDFGLMRQFDYYSGLVLEAYAPGVGLALGGGGRYDRALSAFGTPTPAAGFALSLERLMIALVEQDAVPQVARPDAVVGGEPAAAFETARRLRSEGKGVVLACGITGTDLEHLGQELGAREVLEVRVGDAPEADEEARE